MNRMLLTAICLLAAGCIAGTVSFTWDPPATYLDGTPIDGPLTYTIYEGTNAVVSGVATNAAEVEIPANVDELRYTVRAVNQLGMESAESNPVIGKRTRPPGQFKPEKK